ncbi:MAG: SPOR domain-containing protein [Gemmatimonadaceae bacterium]
MRRTRMIGTWLVAMGSLLGPRVLVAQSGTQSGTSEAARLSVSRGVTAAIGRAQGLMESGDATGARVLLDSLVTSADPLSLDAAEALHWRAVLAERAADGERDWRRLVIDIPLSPRVPEALLRLADMDLVRGRPVSARDEYQRLLSDFPESPSRQVAALGVARSYFEERNLVAGCAAVQALGALEGEWALQKRSLELRCKAAAPSDTSAPAPTATTATEGTKAGAALPEKPVSETATPKGTAEKSEKAEKGEKSEKGEKGASSGRYALQLAAFDSKKEAERVVAKFKARGQVAKVIGTRAPYRVFYGRYATRDDAAEAKARLKKQGQGGFIVEWPK